MKFYLLLLLIFLPGAKNHSFAQTDSTTGAPIVIDGKTLFSIQYGFRGYSPAQRAETIEHRIEVAAETFALSGDSITISESEISSDLVIGDQFVMSVVDGDAKMAGTSRHELAEKLRKIIREEILDYRVDHSTKSILLGVIYLIGATVVLVLILYLIGKVSNRLVSALQSKIRSIQIDAHDVIQADWIRKLLIGLIKMVRTFVISFVVYTYVGIGLTSFPWTQALAHGLFRLVLDPLKTLGNEFIGLIPNLFFLIVLWFITRYLIRGVKRFFDEIEKGTIQLPNFYQDWARPTFKLVRTLIIVLSLVVAFPYIPGSSSAAFQGISIFAGVLFSIGSSSAVANVVAGTILTYMRAFKVGDVVKIGETSGIVEQTSLLVTRIRTPKNVDITVPNSTILNTHVTNYSSQAREGKLILPTAITIGYDAPWRQVHAMLKLAAERTEGVLSEPAPFVLQLALDDFYVRYELNVYVGAAEKMLKIYSSLHQNIQDAFNENGVQIMSPHYEFDRDKPTFVPKDQWYAPPAKQPGEPDADA